MSYGMNTNRIKIPFKDHFSKQMMLLPPCQEELIGVNRLVRIVDRVIDKIDIESLIKTCKGDGTFSFHPVFPSNPGYMITDCLVRLFGEFKAIHFCF